MNSIASNNNVKFQLERFKNALIILWVFSTLGYMTRLAIVNSNSSQGQRLAQLESLKQQLLLENQVLQNRIASNSSLLYISKQASQMGFVPMKNVQGLE